jgi:5-methylcytosine-specific restriction endonuclease McrA
MPLKNWRLPRRRKKREITPEYRQYLQSKHWQEIKTKALAKADGHCQMCGKEHTKLNVHHIHYYTVGHESLEDLLVLCPKCHAKTHGRRKW